MARGSLPYVFITSAISFALFGLMWGVFDTGMIQPMLAENTWQTGSEFAMMGRQYVSTSWEWLPFVILLGLGLTNIIAAKARASASSVITRTVTLFVVHLLLVLWAFVFPGLIDELYQQFATTPEMAEVGFDTGVRYAYELGLGYAPAILALGTDVWYVTAPIRADYFGGVR